MCNANGPWTPGLPASLAMTRCGILPSGMHRPWAESDRKQRFRSAIPFRAGQPVPTFHPRYLSAYASTLDFGETPWGGGYLEPLYQRCKCSILGLGLGATQAGFPPANRQTISSPHVHAMVLLDCVQYQLSQETKECEIIYLY